jgi:hypothetical protein
MGDRHGPNKLTKYIRVHEAHMQSRIASGFVVHDGVEFAAFGKGYYILVGPVVCVGEIVLEVKKILAVVDGKGADERVETVWYSYNAKLAGRGNILRYDSAAGHRPSDHVHRFDVLNGDDEGSVEDIPPREWPTIGKVLDELEEWYRANFERLK